MAIMHAIIPFDRFNPDDFSFCFGARPISPHERGSIRATRLRCAPKAALSPAPPRGGAANTLRYSGYVLGLAPLRAYASAFGAPISAKYGALFSCLAADKLGLRYR